MSLYCSNCGREISDGSYFCEGCGTPVDEVNPGMRTNIPVQQYENLRKTNGWAIAGFVTSFVNVLFCALISPISLGISIAGLILSKRYNGDGKGLSIAGIIISAIFLIYICFIIISLILHSSNTYGSM